jgi:hypothetical protein
MQKFIVGISLLFGAVTSDCQAQGFKFSDFLKQYKKLELPIEEVSELHTNQTIDPVVWNKLVFDNQAERAKFYGTNDTLYRLTTYGRIPEEPFDYRTWVDKERTKRSVKYFDIKAHAIGRINYPAGYIGLLNKVVGFEMTYYDLFVFDEEGNLLSGVNLSEQQYKKNGEPEAGIEATYLKSKITEEGNIIWHQERYNVTTVRIYKIMPDGYFKIIEEKSEGEFDY